MLIGLACLIGGVLLFVETDNPLCFLLALPFAPIYAGLAIEDDYDFEESLED